MIGAMPSPPPRDFSQDLDRNFLRQEGNDECKGSEPGATETDALNAIALDDPPARDGARSDLVLCAEKRGTD
jgi:hypothetical protein